MKSTDKIRIPKYMQIKADIKEAIDSGRFKEDYRLPSRAELISNYGVSWATTNKAIGELETEGYVYQIQGKGTFVASRVTRTLNIALVMPHLYPFGNQEYSPGYEIAPLLVHHIEDCARTIGANIILRLDNDDEDRERENLCDLVQQNIDGIIVYYLGGLRNQEYLLKIKDSGIPLVLIDRYVEGLDINYVLTDNIKGGYRATTHLLKSGFSKMLCFAIENDPVSSRNRVSGYTNAVNDWSFPVDSTLIRVNSTEHDVATMEARAYETAKTALQDHKPPMGIFAANTPLLTGVFLALQEMDVDFSQIGLASFDEPRLGIPESCNYAKIIQPLDKIAQTSLQIIMDCRNGNHELQQYMLQPRLVTEHAMNGRENELSII
jgi:GntR family transcriptional regulator of arabinose operon